VNIKSFGLSTPGTGPGAWRMHIFGTNGKGKSRGTWPTKVHLENGC